MHMYIHGLASLATALLTISIDTQLGAQTPTWSQSLPTAGPSARDGHALVYDSLRNKTVLFGGATLFQYAGGYMGDTWEWDGTQWTQAPVVGPGIRSDHAMAYDSQRGVTVLFGGDDFTLLGDTFEWDGSTWAQASSSGPAVRAGHAMAYDSQRGATVLFGGGSASGRLGDTWEWDGSNWTQRATTGPSARAGHAMAYDRQRGVTVMFGGYASIGGFSDETWEWNGLTWTNVTPLSGPSPRLGHAMAYDIQRGKTVLFGDSSAGNDTWEYDGSTWTHVGGSTSPSGRMQHAMAYDGQRGVTVLFGGRDFSSLLADTWELSAHRVSMASVFGNGCGNPALDLAPVSSAPPTINTTAQASLTNVPTPPSIAFIAMGWNTTTTGAWSLPLPLDDFGLPGCVLLQSSEAAAEPTTTTGPGTATFNLPLPGIPGLIGLQIYLQGWAIAPGYNVGGVIVSNGVHWTIGNA